MNQEITQRLDADQYQLDAHARHAAFEVRDADRCYSPTHIAQCQECGGVFLATDTCPQCGSVHVADSTNYETEGGRRFRELHNDEYWRAERRTMELRRFQRCVRSLLSVGHSRQRRARSRRSRIVRGASKSNTSDPDSSSSEPPGRRALQLGGAS